MAVTTGLHSDYIKMTVGPILVHCLKEVSEIQPKDPIDYIARWLYNQNNNLLLYHRKIKDIVKYDQAKLQVAAEDKNRKTKIKKLKHSLSDIKKESNSLEVEIEEALWHRQQILKETCIALAAKRNVQLNTYQDDQMRSLEALLASKIKRSAKKHKPVRILLPTLGKTSTSSISRSEEEEEMTSSESETSSFEESEDEDSDESEEEEDEQDSNESDEVERTESQQRADKQMKIKEEQQQIKTLKKALGEGKTLDLKNLLLLKKFLTKTTKGDKKKVRRASSLPSIFSTVSKGGAVEKSNKMDIVKPGHHELKIKHKTLVPQGRMGIRPPKRKKPTILPSTKEVQGESAVPEIASSPPLPRPHSPETDVHSDPNYYLSTDNADSYELFKKSSSFLELMEEEHAEPEKTIPENILLDKTSLHKKKGKRKPRELKTEDARGISEYASEETTSKIFIATSQTSAPDIPEEDFQRSEIEDFSKSDISLTKSEKRQVLGRMKKASAHKDETTRVETVKISQRESSLSSTDEESLEDLEEGMGSEEGEMVEEVDEKMKLRSKKGKTLKKPSRRSIPKILNDELASRHVPEKKSKKMAGKSESRHVKKSREKVYTEETRDVTSEQKDLGAEFIKRDSPVSGESTSISSHTPTIQRSQESLYSDLEELTAAADMEWEDTELRDTVTYEKYERTRIVDSKGEMVERKTDEYPESVIRSSKEKSRESPQIDKAGRLEKKQRQQLVPQFVTWRCTWRQQLVCEHPTLGDMVPKPPLLTRENADWWENQDFTPEVLFDHEIYTRKNDDEVGGDESTSLRLTLQDFVGPGTSVADENKTTASIEQQIKQPYEPSKRESKKFDDRKSSSTKIPFEDPAKQIMRDDKKKRLSDKTIPKLKSDDKVKATEKKTGPKTGNTAYKTSTKHADGNNNATVSGLFEEVSTNNGTSEEEERCALKQSKRFSFSDRHSIFLTSNVESAKFVTNAACAEVNQKMYENSSWKSTSLGKQCRNQLRALKKNLISPGIGFFDTVQRKLSDTPYDPTCSLNDYNPCNRTILRHEVGERQAKHTLQEGLFPVGNDVEGRSTMDPRKKQLNQTQSILLKVLSKQERSQESTTRSPSRAPVGTPSVLREEESMGKSNSDERTRESVTKTIASQTRKQENETSIGTEISSSKQKVRMTCSSAIDQTRSSCIKQAITSPSKRPGRSDEALQQRLSESTRKLNLLEFFDESNTHSSVSESNCSFMNHLNRSQWDKIKQYQEASSLNGESKKLPHLTILPNTDTCPSWKGNTEIVTREPGVSDSNEVLNHRNLKNRNGKKNKSNKHQGDMSTSCKSHYPDYSKFEASERYMSLKQVTSSKLIKTEQAVIFSTSKAPDRIIKTKGKKETEARSELLSKENLTDLNGKAEEPCDATLSWKLNSTYSSKPESSFGLPSEARSASHAELLPSSNVHCLDHSTTDTSSTLQLSALEYETSDDETDETRMATL